LVGPSGAVARVVLSVSFVTHLASGRVRAFTMNRPGVHGDAGLAPAVGLILFDRGQLSDPQAKQ